MCGTILSAAAVKVRKPRRCWGCTKLFPVGTVLEKVNTADGGEVHSAYWCKSCMARPREDYFGEECLDYGHFAEVDRERKRDEPPAPGGEGQ